jgi:coenzyme PQQ precursor peptide PqqA
VIATARLRPGGQSHEIHEPQLLILVWAPVRGFWTMNFEPADCCWLAQRCWQQVVPAQGSQGLAQAGEAANDNPLSPEKTMWSKPEFTEMRFGFEVTMYIYNR